MSGNYWDNVYWEKHLKEDNLENIEELWIKQYEDIFANKVNWLWSHKRWKRDFREEEIVEYERLYGEKPFGN